MFIIIHPDRAELAEHVYNTATTQYQHDYRTFTDGLPHDLSDIRAEDLYVTVADLDEYASTMDAGEYRWMMLTMMSKGVVFVDYGHPYEGHFYNTEGDQDEDGQVHKIVVAGAYAENRVKALTTVGKIHYAGPTYTAPIAVVVTSYNSKKDSYSLDYDLKVANVLSSLPSDLWMKVGFLTARQSVTLGNAFDLMPYSAIVTLETKVTKKIEGHAEATQVKPPRSISTEFGMKFNETVKQTEIEDETE